jgi:hypothetical protein
VRQGQPPGEAAAIAGDADQQDLHRQGDEGQPPQPHLRFADGRQPPAHQQTGQEAGDDAADDDLWHWGWSSLLFRITGRPQVPAQPHHSLAPLATTSVAKPPRTIRVRK